jgi:hypothetical protein
LFFVSARVEAWASGTTQNFYAQEITEAKSGRPGRQYFAKFPATTLAKLRIASAENRISVHSELLTPDI